LARHIEQLDAQLPNAVAAVVLGRARRAVGGLRQMQSEFFLASRVENGSLRLPNRNAGQPDVFKPLPDASAEYILLMRNATHGFAKTFRERPDLVALFGAHTGVMPDLVSDVPWLHLVRILADPEQVLNNLGPRHRTLAGPSER